MLEGGDPVPEVRVWTTLGEDTRLLRDVLGDGLSLLCVYVFDWT